MAQYATQETVESVLQRKLTEYESLNIGIYLESASDYIERLTGRSWGEGSSTKLYNGDGGNSLYIDPTTTITLVERLDKTGAVLDTLDLSYVSLWPLNKDIKTSIIYKSGRFVKGYGNYRVTGVADSVVPSVIKHATALLVADRLGNPDNIKAESIEGYSVTYDNSSNNEAILDILGPYIKVLI